MQAAFCNGCQWKYISVYVVQSQVKNALVKAVHVTDCTTCSLTELLQRRVIELYYTAVLAFDVCRLPVRFITLVFYCPCGVLPCAPR